MKERDKMNFLIGLIIIAIDQFIKIIVTANIPYGESVGRLIKITNISNTGMAYGIRAKQEHNYTNCKYFDYIFFNKIFNKKL